MNSRNEREHYQWQNYPPKRKCVPPKGFPSDCCGDKSQRQTNIPETNMNLLVTSGTTFAIFETLPVFLDRQHSLRIHQVLRAWSSVWWHRFPHSTRRSAILLTNSISVPNMAP